GVKREGREIETLLRVHCKRLRSNARKNVNLTGLQRGEALERGQRNEPHLLSIPEDCGCQRSTEGYVKTRPDALWVRRRDAWPRSIRTTYQLSALLNCGQSGPIGCICVG